MVLSMFSAQTSPIAIDFGSSAVKMLQITPGDNPAIQAAIGLRVPDAVRLDRDARIERRALLGETLQEQEGATTVGANQPFEAA